MSDDFPEIPEDRYRIFQHIGKGAFSRVFLAYTPEYQRRAVKRIRLTAKPHMLLKEVEFLRRLEGKSNIVQLKEILFSERNFQTTVVTNYLDSDDFKSIILEFTPLDIQRYMRSLLQALSHLENAAEPSGEIRGILHRDVKPGNFLFERSSGKGLLIDFGLAQSLREAREFPLLRLQRRTPYTFAKPYSRQFPISQPVSRESSSRSLPTQPHSGTHGYRAPEILVPVLNQTPKIDTWSAGVILLQILTGKTSIFRGNPNTDIYELLAIRSVLGSDRFIQQMSSLEADFSFAPISMPQNISFQELAEYYNPDLLAVLPASCFDLCDRLLAFDPKQRLSASESLRHPFLQAQDLPHFRFQDGVWSKNPLALIEGQDENQALKRRSQAISEALGLCKSTSETLADEYSKMILSQMIPLPKDVRKQIERAVQSFGADQSQNVNGFIIQRQRPADYQFPGSQSVQDLSACAPVTLNRPRLAAGFGWQTRFELCQRIYDTQIELKLTELKSDDEYKLMSREQQEKKERKLRESLKVSVFQQQFALANGEKEEYERAVRQTAMRRRVDPWIQPLKALDKELRLVQRQVRKQAEEYRRCVIEKGVLLLDDDMQQSSKETQQSQIPQTHVRKYDIVTENNISSVSLKSQVRQIFNQRYPRSYTVNSANQNRICAFFLGGRVQDKNSRAQELISQAWLDAERRQVEHTSTNTSITKIQELNKRAAHLAAFSHRIALNGPGEWNCQGYIFYCSVAMPSDIDQQQYYRDIAARVYQFQRSLLLFQQQIKENDQFISDIQLKLKSKTVELEKYKTDVSVYQKNLQQPGYNKTQVQAELTQTQDMVSQCQLLISQFNQQITQLTTDKETIQAQINSEAKDRKEYFETYQNNLPANQTEAQPDNSCFENESNLWSETLSISDEFSEAKPNADINADKLAEPYFVNFEEIKKIFQIKNTETQSRKTRRENMRKFERVYAKFYDPSVTELQEIQKELYQEKQKLRELNDVQFEHAHQELLPRDQRIGLLAKTAALQATTPALQQPQLPAPATANPQSLTERNLQLQINSKLEIEKKQNAVFQLFSSPLGRFYIAFYRLIGGKADDLTNRGLLLSLCKKADIPISKRLQELQFTLQKLSAQYAKSVTGKSDLLLSAASVQSELDLRADLANAELANLGLSKRPPNLEYLLQIDKKLSPITRKLNNMQRSTSAITGLTKSATHRSLADPGRTQSRYPQTAKYIQTMLEQTMRRYITMDGVLENYEKEMESGIQAIKARIMEVQVQKLRNECQGKDRVEIGRIQDSIKELGAAATFEIMRGKAFPKSVLREQSSGFDGSVIGDFERRKLLLDDRFSGKKHRRMVEMYRK
ncbi:Kinase, CDC7 [Spironucleus salmonicida]|uniref:Kinase, CDC7 n=1 Tax=Spironucleus salmonicida TaxID=348837 RepID=V6LGT2_9EUKA|nr:Kinase, CDC7 [Spironucleus salmonicida]|eukprot:EST43518.1 Kinase, CDC7 [Spironucleus salmonicida]